MLLPKREAAEKPLRAAPLETEMLAIWQQVLEAGRSGLMMISWPWEGTQSRLPYLALVNEHYGMNLQLIDIFTTPTVALMAQLVQQNNRN